MKETDWDIKKRAEACDECGRAFADLEPLNSRLYWESGVYVRRDLCAACAGGEQRPGVLSAWRGVFRLPPPPPPEVVQKETAESLLRKLVADENARQVSAMFILAVMLERRRILVEREVQQREDGAKIRIYEHKKTGDVFMIVDPQLKLADLERVQAEVIALLEGKPLEGAPADAPPAADPTPGAGA